MNEVQDFAVGTVIAGNFGGEKFWQIAKILVIGGF